MAQTGTLLIDITKEEKHKVITKEDVADEETTMEEKSTLKEDVTEDVAHIPVMLEEVIAFMEPKDNQVMI